MSAAGVVRALVLDDHLSFGEALASLLETTGIEVAGLCGSVEEATPLVLADSLRLAFLDLELRPGRAEGLQVAELVRSRQPACALVFISQHVVPEGALLQRAATLEPEGILSKTESAQNIRRAIDVFLAGGRFVSESLRPYVGHGRRLGAFDRMTPTERRILHELATSPDSRARLAARLEISTSTLDSHLGSMRAKVLRDLEETGEAPPDRVLTLEQLIGWAIARGHHYE